MDKATRSAIIEKAEKFQIEYDASYWEAKEPPEPIKFIHACYIIQSLTGLVVHLLEEDVTLCE